MRDKERKGVAAMSKYIENVNTYLTQMKIKQTFMKPGNSAARESLSGRRPGGGAEQSKRGVGSSVSAESLVEPARKSAAGAAGKSL